MAAVAAAVNPSGSLLGHSYGIFFFIAYNAKNVLEALDKQLADCDTQILYESPTVS